MKLGKNIIDIRKQNNLTQDDLANKYFVTRQTISNWENSKSYPDLETLIKISDDFNISLDILLKEDNEMVKNISKKQNNYKYIKIFVAILNIIGVACLIYFSIPLIRHDAIIANPNAMLASYSWDSCGFILTLGLIPLVIANTMAFMFLDLKKKVLKVLFYIPSLICLVLVSGYLFMSFNENQDTYKPELISSMKCVLNEKTYHYTLYKEIDGTYSSSIEEHDKIPYNIINNNSIEEWIDSIEKYYKNNGGMCP